MKRGDFTVIIARVSQAPARKFTIPKRVARAAVAAAAILVGSLFLSSMHYYYMWNKSRDFVRLKSEVVRLRKQNEVYRVAARQLSDRLSLIEVSAQKLRIVSGLEDDGLGGVGGPGRPNDAALALDQRSLYRHFRSLDRKSFSLQNELRKLQEYYKNRNILLAATPSLMPVNGYPSDRYGMRADPFTGNRDFHPGIDISAPRGNKVVATADGTVEFAANQVGYGKLVTISHRFGITTRYGHLARISVTRGQKVRKGDVIGYVGATGRATGPHVHYEVRLNGQPLDPLRFLSESD